MYLEKKENPYKNKLIKMYLKIIFGKQPSQHINIYILDSIDSSRSNGSLKLNKQTPIQMESLLPRKETIITFTWLVEAYRYSV